MTEALDLDSLAQPVYRLGIDAGSKTIKAVILDAQDNIVYSLYKRHGSNIRETLHQVIHDIKWMRGDLAVTPAVTGSAGINVVPLIGAPYVQEVVATTHAVQRKIPQADAIVELGGEDAKVVYLTGGMEQRMNATCAGGTGGFIDTIAFMLGLRTKDISTVAMGARRIYPIASRCAVFAQTDVRPLLNAGASKADIAASALDAVVRQVLGGLACGRPIRGKVVFLGGPCEYIPALVEGFRRALGLNRDDAIKPPDAHLFPAMGAVFAAEGKGELGAPIQLSALEDLLADPACTLDDSSLERLAPLFSSEEELAAFRAHHGQEAYPTGRLFDSHGPLFLGIDCGSTTVKLAVLDQEGRLLHNAYRPSRGETVETLQEMLGQLYSELPQVSSPGCEKPYIAHVAATGYGEAMLTTAFNADSSVVETVAHARAARQVRPGATFVLDIGGQDIKALWLDGDLIGDAVLNEACSSGCGAFIEGTAHSLRTTPYTFAEEALEAKSPVDLGTRCTVFMASRVKHAQKVGVTRADIAAGVAYSVIYNALYRIIGKERLGNLGDKVVVQGGTFCSDAVLRAFELVCGVQALRSDRAHLMGAIGAALVARDRWEAGGAKGVSGLIDRETLQGLRHDRRTVPCGGCENRCLLSVLDFGGDRKLVTGNRCEKGQRLEGASPALGGFRLADSPPGPLPNLIKREQELLAASAPSDAAELSGVVASTGAAAPSQRMRIGVIDSLEGYPYAPFWYGLLESLGFDVLLPVRRTSPSLWAQAWESVPSESLCFPAKLAHAKAFALRDSGAQALLFPAVQRGNHCAVSCEYPLAMKDSISWMREGEMPLALPRLSSSKPQVIARNDADFAALMEALAPLCESSGHPLTEDSLTAALSAGLEAQQVFQRTLETQTEEALDFLAANPGAHGILLAGRPYHSDPLVMHDIDEMLSSLGFVVLGMEGLAPHFTPAPPEVPGAAVWKPAKHLLKAARFVLDNPQIDLVCLQSFGCGYDAMSLEEVRSLLRQHSRPFTVLKIDEMVETAHIRIRLRTLAESIELRKASSLKELPDDARRDRAGRGGAEQGVAPVGKSGPVVNLLAKPLDERDLAVARSSTVKDACFTADVLAARAIRLLREDPSISAFVVPEVCKDCLNEAVARIVERACGFVPEFRWESPLEAGVGEPSSFNLDRPSDDRPLIGIVGNPLLVFDPFMNDNIVQLIEDFGCRAVLPDPDALHVEDVSYLDQLEEFARLGVSHVIYLQSFGCVKAHVHGRGMRHQLEELFPSLSITVIDYDPEASALNRENRIRLVAETALLGTP